MRSTYYARVRRRKNTRSHLTNPNSIPKNFPQPQAKTSNHHHAEFETHISRKTRDVARQNPRPALDAAQSILLTENAQYHTPSVPSLLNLLPSMSTITPVQENPPCPACGCKYTVKKGKRRNRLQLLQVYRCTECLHRFTANPGKNRTYPLALILETVSTFNLGYSMTEVQGILRKRFHRNVPERTITSWVTEYRPLTTYSRLRRAGQKLFRPENIIRSHTFHHQQVYRFQVHQAKLALLTHIPALATPARATLGEDELSGLTAYLESIETHFPHYLFQATQHRSSKFPANLHPPITRKENHATRLAALVFRRPSITRSATRPYNGSCSSMIP